MIASKKEAPIPPPPRIRFASFAVTAGYYLLHGAFDHSRGCRRYAALLTARQSLSGWLPGADPGSGITYPSCPTPAPRSTGVQSEAAGLASALDRLRQAARALLVAGPLGPLPTVA